MIKRGTYKSGKLPVYEGDLPKPGEERKARSRLLFTYEIRITNIREDVKVKLPRIIYQLDSDK